MKRKHVKIALSNKNRANSHQLNPTKFTRINNHNFEWFSYERGNGWQKKLFLIDFS